jgi:hypothetical protein
MSRRPVWPIVLAAAIPAFVALPGIVLGALQLWEAWTHPPAGGVVSLGTILGFWLLLGSLFVVCAAVLLAGLALDVRALRNASSRE